MAIKKAGGQSYVAVTRAGSSASKPNSTGLQFQFATTVGRLAHACPGKAAWDSWQAENGAEKFSGEAKPHHGSQFMRHSRN